MDHTPTSENRSLFNKILFLVRKDSLRILDLLFSLAYYYRSVVCCWLICQQSHALDRAEIWEDPLHVDPNAPLLLICKVAPGTAV